MRIGYMEVASGMNDVVLVGGVEKMTDSTGPEATFGLGTATEVQSVWITWPDGTRQQIDPPSVDQTITVAGGPRSE